MCKDCHARTARQAQSRIRVLTLMRDCAIDDGLAPGPMLLAEIKVQHDRKLEAENELMNRYGLALTIWGELSRPVVL